MTRHTPAGPSSGTDPGQGGDAGARAVTAVTVNGHRRNVPTGCTVTGLLALLDLHPDGLAVAVDGAVAPRAGWHRPLPDGAVVDVLSAVPGG